MKPQRQSAQPTGQNTQNTTDKTAINAPLNALNSDNLSMALRYITEIGMTESRLDSVIVEAERLITAAKQVKDNLKPARHATGGININPYQRCSIIDIMRQQAQQRSLEPMPLEAELLLQRVKDGGHSGQYLADAFLSAYRTHKPFPHSLGELTKLDAEAFRLFHQVLHIRDVSGWKDDDLYQIEQQINAILQHAVKEGN